ncbi:MAG: hypothetical protein J6B54_02315 [Clostridia bacterium]|nr:hypothetical protein [Clostridia bacterium]
MKKTVIRWILIPILFLSLSLSLSAQTVDEVLDKTEEETGYASFLEAIPEESVRFFEEYGIDLSSDAPAPALSKIVKMFLSVFFLLLSEHLPLLTTGMATLLLFKLLFTLCSKNQRLMESLGYLSVVSSGVYSFAVIESLLSALTEITEQTASFLTAALPVISAARVWSGSQQGASVISATLPLILTVLSSVVTTLYYPLCWFCYAASLSGFFRNQISLRPIISSVKKFCIRGVEILSGLSVGVFCVQRAAVASSDTVARKGVRFALLQLLPLAGGSLTEGIETVYACGRSLCGKIGVISVLAVAALFATPCIMGFFFVFLYSFLSSAGSFLGVGLLSDFYGDIKDTFSMMTCFSVCSLVVVSSALLLLTGG